MLSRTFFLSLGKKIDKKVVQNMHHVEKKILDSLLTFNGKEFEVEILRRSFLDKIMFRKSRKFKLNKIVMAQISMISSKLLDTPFYSDVKLTDTQHAKKNIEFASDEKIINSYLEICTIFLEGAKTPSEKTIKFLKDNMSFSDIFQLISSVIANAGYADFMNTILLTNYQLGMKTGKAE